MDTKKIADLFKTKESPLWFSKILLMLALVLFFTSLAKGLFWIVLVVLVWGYLYKFGLKLFAMTKLSFGVFFSIVIFVWLIFLMLMISIESTGTGTDSVTKMTTEELRQYDGKTLIITSGDEKLSGQVQLKLTEGKNSSYLMARYIIQIQDDLKANGLCGSKDADNFTGCTGSIYEYANDLVIPGDEKGEGGLSVAYCNFGKYPTDFSDSMFYSRETCGISGVNTNTPTNKFVATFGRSFTDYNKILSLTQFDLYDAADYWTVSEEQTTGDTTTYSGELDTNAAVASGVKVRSYTITYVE